ncbi:MAG: hypothetical protein IJW29_04885 [Clostridia bacterium]|nr:hypothetical protein [Clostridia bacterium]
MKNVKRLLMSVLALVMIVSTVFTMSACDMTNSGGSTGDPSNPPEEWGDDIQVTPGQNGYGGEGKIKITFKATYANETETALVTVNASSATVEAFVRDFLASPLGDMLFTEMFPYGVWELNGTVMTTGDVNVTLRDGDTLHLKLHTLPTQMGGSVDSTVDGSFDFDDPDQTWGNDVATTPGQNGYGGMGSIKIGFRSTYQGETADVMIVVAAQSITLEALIRDYLDGPLAGMSFTEILPYGAWYYNGALMGPSGYTQVLVDGDLITLAMRTIPGQDDDDDNGGASSDFVKVSVKSSDGFESHKHIVTASSGTEPLYSIVYIAVGVDMEELLAKGVTVFVNDVAVTAKNHPIRNGDHVVVNIVGTDLDSDQGGQGPTTAKDYTVDVLLMYADNTYESDSRSIHSPMTLADFLEEYVEISFDKSLRYGKWRVDGVDVSDGSYVLRGGECVMFRQNGLNNSDDWGTGIKGTATTHGSLSYSYDIVIPTEGITAGDLYNQYFNSVFGIDLDKALHENDLLFLVNDCRIFDAQEAEKVMVYPDSPVEIYWYSIPEGYEDTFAANLTAPADASVCLSFLDGSADYIGFWTVSGYTVRQTFELHGYSYDYYAQYGYFCDSDDRHIPGNSQLPEDGYFRWVQETPFPSIDLSVEPDGDFSINLGFKFEEQSNEVTVRFDKEDLTLDKFIMEYLSEEYFDGMDYNNLSKCGSWYFENELCTKSTVITDGGYLEFRITEMPEDGSFDGLFDATTPDNPGSGDVSKLIIVMVNVSGVFTDGTVVGTAAQSVEEGTTLREVVDTALERHNMSYADTLAIDGYWTVNGNKVEGSYVLASGAKIEFVRNSSGGDDSGDDSGDTGDTTKQILVYTVTLDDTGMQLLTPVYVKEGTTLAELVATDSGMSYEAMLSYGYFTVNGETPAEGGAYVLNARDKIRFVESGDVGGGDDSGDDSGDTQDMILVYLTVIIDGQPETQEIEVVKGTTLYDLANLYTTWGYEGSLAYGYWTLNANTVGTAEEAYVTLNSGDEIEFVQTVGGGVMQEITVYYETVDDTNGETVRNPILIVYGTTLYDFVRTYANLEYDESLEYGYWTINGESAASEYESLNDGDVIAFVTTGGGDTHTHEWNAESGTCFTCGEPCPVDHATEAIYEPCYNCGYAGYAGGGYEHRMFTIYVNGEWYTTVTAVCMPGEYPTMNDVLALTDLGTFDELNERYVILSNEREAEWTSGNNYLYYDTEIYFNTRPEEILPTVEYTVYYTKFYAGDSWQSATKGNWTYITAGTTLSDAIYRLGADIWENDRFWINGVLVSDWESMTVEGDTYIVVLEDGIEDPSITATVVNEITGKTRTVVYDAPVYFSMVRNDLIGELDEGLTWNIEVDGSDWGTSVTEYAIANNFTITISEATSNVSIKVVDSDNKVTVLNQEIKGALPTLAEFVKTYLGGDPEAYYFASVDGGELRELSAEDPVPQYWGYIIPRAQIKDEITITYDVTHKYNGTASGSVTVKSPVLLYYAFDSLEDSYLISEVLWDSWCYEILVNGEALSEEDKGGSFALLWDDCTVVAKPCYYVRIEYMEFIGELPAIDPVLVSDPDLTIAEVLEMMGVDTSMFVIEMDLTMRVGDAFSDFDNAVIYARPKTLIFEITVPDMSGGDMLLTVDGFMGSATLEEVKQRFSEMFGMPTDDYVWLCKDDTTGEMIELVDPTYTWYYNEETQNGNFYLTLFLKNITVAVDILDRNGNLLEWREVVVENGSPVSAVLAEFGYSADEVMQIFNVTYGYQMTLDEGIAQPIALQIWLNSGTIQLYIAGDSGHVFTDEEIAITGSMTLAAILSERGFGSEHVRWASLDGSELGAFDSISGGYRIEVQIIYYPVYFYIEDEYGNVVVEVYEWIWGRVTVGELLERYGSGYTWSQIASGDCAAGEATADTVIEYEDKITLRLYPAGATEGGGESEGETITVYIEDHAAAAGSPNHYMHEVAVGTTLADFIATGAFGVSSYENMLKYGYYLAVNGQSVSDVYSYVLQHKDSMRLIPNGESADSGITAGAIIVYLEMTDAYDKITHEAYEIDSGATLNDFLMKHAYCTYDDILATGYYVTVEDVYVNGDYVMQSKDVVRLVTEAPDNEGDNGEVETPTSFTIYYADMAYSMEAPICLRDFIMNYLGSDMDYEAANGTWFVDGMAVYPVDCWISETCTLTYGSGDIAYFEVYFENNCYTMSAPISLYDFLVNYPMVTDPYVMGSWYVDGVHIDDLYAYELSYTCTVTCEVVETPIVGFEVYFEGNGYWLDGPMPLYDFICKYLGIVSEDGTVGTWYVDGMYIENLYDYELSYSCTLSREYSEEVITGFEVNCNGYTYWLEGPMSLYDFAYKLAYADLGTDPEQGYWSVDGESVDLYSYTLTYGCKIQFDYVVPVTETAA